MIFWLKQVASRPRYKYLITLNDPKSEFRNWWQMIPNLAGSDDNFKSWPSGNMTIYLIYAGISSAFLHTAEGK